MTRDTRPFVKKKEYLVCVDSDGCAMDTMDVKHTRCFGPCLVEEWGLQDWAARVLSRWNTVNLYTMTRGVNRFKGLALVLEEVDEKLTPVEGLDAYCRWARTSAELSEAALEAHLAAHPGPCLEKALRWSRAVNRRIGLLGPQDKQPFPGVPQGLAAAHAFADVAVVSSANRGAVQEEWGRCGLLDHVDVLLAQDSGTKSQAIRSLLEQGYQPGRVLMVGDAPGDRDAAHQNGVGFYPILVGREAESWQELRDVALPKLQAGDYAAYGRRKLEEFLGSLCCDEA